MNKTVSDSDNWQDKLNLKHEKVKESQFYGKSWGILQRFVDLQAHHQTTDNVFRICIYVGTVKENYCATN